MLWVAYFFRRGVPGAQLMGVQVCAFPWLMGFGFWFTSWVVVFPGLIPLVTVHVFLLSFVPLAVHMEFLAVPLLTTKL
jgi:hypothetical protein